MDQTKKIKKASLLEDWSIGLGMDMSTWKRSWLMRKIWSIDISPEKRVLVWSVRLETKAAQLPPISTGYVSSALLHRLLSDNPHQVRFQSTQTSMVDSWLRRQSSSRVNHIISHNHSYRSVLLKTTTRSVPDRRISRRACVCLFCEICVLVSTQSVLFWKITGCCLLFWRLTSCLLRAKFSWIAASCAGICQI